MGIELPYLNSRDYIILEELRVKFPHQFYSNVTSFLIDEMRNYIKNQQVWRMTIMGETRLGKSETGQTIAFKYISIFNHLWATDKEFRKRIQDRLDKIVSAGKLDFDVPHIMENQSAYLLELRKNASAKTLKFGQIWQIDESKFNSGLGSYTEKLELTNLNNIIAKFCQSELWLTPRNFIEANAPYGMRMYKKDIKNRCNWGLLYKIDMTPSGTEYLFLGWVKIPLHSNSKHRRKYETKKNKWIGKEIEGGADERMVLRHQVATMLSKDKDFCTLNAKGTNFLRNAKQQKGILEEWIMAGKIQNFNELEKETIISFARDKAYKIVFGGNDGEEMQTL